MRVRLAAAALLVLAGFGCGGRAAAPVESNPAQRPVAVAEPAPARHPDTATHPEATGRHEAPAPAPAMRLDAPSRAARRDSTLLAGPPTHEVRHTLRRGQTLYSLARVYGIPFKELMAANGISDPRSIPAGAEILIPGARARLPYRPAAAGGRAEPRDPGEPGRSVEGLAEAAIAAADIGVADGEGTHADGSGGDADRDDDRRGDGEHHGDGGEAPNERHAVRAGPSESLQWPLHGAITGPYGRRGRSGHHTGVDIDGERGDPILAAASGVVVSAGTDGPYGRRVEIDHGDGIVTLYAHADRLLVHAGEQVRAGQRIAEVGRSGNARGTHLHFEVRRDGRIVDPMPYLRDNGLLTAGVN